jgi:asparagine synthase (glutamine-hydrolysing)
VYDEFDSVLGVSSTFVDQLHSEEVRDIVFTWPQPFTDASGRYTIVFNGEFFNFSEHKQYILNKGYTLRSTSDTEILLYLFIIDGIECLQKINGFFAFAIYDNITEEIFIARDRSGIKPLYFLCDENHFIFASELKALVEFDFKKELDYSSMLTYFHLNYIPAPHSIFRGVQKYLPDCGPQGRVDNF